MSANNSERHITESGHVCCAKNTKKGCIVHGEAQCNKPSEGGAVCVVVASIVGKTVRQ